jgi:O-6-methylguanine DNA methyltransferase
MSAFATRVISVVRRIPPGRVATYGDVALAAGQPRAARAVGNIMSHLGERGVPAHRVVAAGGRIGGFGGNIELKRALLRAEGVTVGRSIIRDFAVRRWPGQTEARPRTRGGAARTRAPAKLKAPRPR